MRSRRIREIEGAPVRDGPPVRSRALHVRMPASDLAAGPALGQSVIAKGSASPLRIRPQPSAPCQRSIPANCFDHDNVKTPSGRDDDARRETQQPQAPDSTNSSRSSTLPKTRRPASRQLLTTVVQALVGVMHGIDLPCIDVAQQKHRVVRGQREPC